MKTIKARFDGSVFVPDEPVELPSGCEAEVRLTGVPEGVTSSSPRSESGTPEPCTEPGPQGDHDDAVGGHPVQERQRTLAKLLEVLDQMPDNPDWPPDGAAQHDHYLYGMPKRP
jgi:predicted DNA-binding antitoxin AbrB/MazE fold protein